MCIMIEWSKLLSTSELDVESVCSCSWIDLSIFNLDAHPVVRFTKCALKTSFIIQHYSHIHLRKKSHSAKVWRTNCSLVVDRVIWAPHYIAIIHDIIRRKKTPDHFIISVNKAAAHLFGTWTAPGSHNFIFYGSANEDWMNAASSSDGQQYSSRSWFRRFSLCDK